MCSRPALPNICGANGDSSEPRSSANIAACACRSGRVRSVYFIPERAPLHLLEADRQRAVGEPALDRLAREQQRARAGRAVVVDVHHRDPGQAEPVDRALPVGRVAVARSRRTPARSLVRDAGVGERASRRPRAPSPGSPPPWCRACRTSSSRRRSRTCGCSSAHLRCHAGCEPAPDAREPTRRRPAGAGARR